MGVPAQTPLEQVSPVVHGFWSSQEVPFPLVGFVHAPVPELHVPATWHWSSGAHATVVPTHTPPEHLSFVVHSRPSLQVEPSPFTGLLHTPPEQDPAVWQSSDAGQERGVPTQVPAEQA